MVRNIIGTLVEVGLEQRAAELAPLLAARDRTLAGATAPAAGLCLVGGPLRTRTAHIVKTKPMPMPQLMASLDRWLRAFRADDDVVGQVEVETGQDGDIVEGPAVVEDASVDLGTEREELGAAYHRPRRSS